MSSLRSLRSNSAAHSLTAKNAENAKILKELSDDPSLSSLCSLRLSEWWEVRIARQKEIDASIAAKADSEYLYEKPYENKKTVRVAGPFTVESLSQRGKTRSPL